MLKLLKGKISAPAIKELIEAIENFSGPLDKMKDDSRIKQKVKSMRAILK